MERRNVDEIILLDIEASAERREPRGEKIRELTRGLFAPICYGGGISTLEHIKICLANGADKVAIWSGAKIIKEAAEKFGSQAIVGVVTHPNVTAHAAVISSAMEMLGAGEILLVDRELDGTTKGYNLDTIKEVSKDISVPLIACGGCGNIAHMHAAIKSGASAVAAGSMFLYTEITPKMCADVLHGQFRVPVRIHA